MRFLRHLVGLVTACVFFLETASVAHAQAVQPIPYTPSQPVPTQPGAPASGSAPPAGASPGMAQPGRGGNDAIYLKGGGLLRGTLVEMIPNDHATMTLPTGQTAIVEWQRIDRIERQGAAAGGPGPAMPQSMQPPPQNRGNAVVHLNADADVSLETRATSQPGGFIDPRWTPACTTPCDKSLPVDNDYRIVGPGIRPSRTFRLGVQPGEKVYVGVHAGSKAGFTGGIVLLAIGGAAAIVGLTVALVGAAESAATTYDAATGTFVSQNNGTGTEVAGWVIAALGAAAVVVGVILMVNNARTKEVQEPMGQARLPVYNDALRQPTWRDRSATELGMPKANTTPIFSLSF